MKVMAGLKNKFPVALADGRNELTWTTPSGFVVTQEADEKGHQVVTLQLMGRFVKSMSQAIIRGGSSALQECNITESYSFSLDASLYTYLQSASTLRWPSLA